MSSYCKSFSPLICSWSSSLRASNLTSFSDSSEDMSRISHSCTVEKLFAWEKKLYLEVKVCKPCLFTRLLDIIGSLPCSFFLSPFLVELVVPDCQCMATDKVNAIDPTLLCSVTLYLLLCAVTPPFFGYVSLWPMNEKKRRRKSHERLMGKKALQINYVCICCRIVRELGRRKRRE